MSDLAVFMLAGLLCLYPGRPCKLLLIDDLTKSECEFLRAGFVRQRDDDGEPVAWDFHCGRTAVSTIVRKR